MTPAQAPDSAAMSAQAELHHQYPPGLELTVAAHETPEVVGEWMRRLFRRQGLRPVRIWVADTRAPGFAEEARRQSLAIAASAPADDDQTFIDSISEFNEERTAANSG